MKQITFIFWLFCLWACNDNSRQDEVAYLTCEQDKLVFNKEAGVKSLPCETNVDKLKFSFDQEGEDWCQGSFAEGKLVFEVLENQQTRPRETTVTVGNAEVFIKIVVFQTGTDPVLVLSPDTLRVAAYESTVQTVVSTNIEYEVTVTDENNWITILPAEEGEENIQKFRIAENSGQVTRTGTVTFQQKEGTLKSVLTVIQQNPVYTAELKVPFGRMGFIEPLEYYAQKRKEGIREWRRDDIVVKFFVNVAGEPQADDSLFMEVMGHAYEDARLKLKINGEDAGTLQVNTGDFRLALPAFVPPSSNYQCISFEGMDGEKHYPDLDTMVIRHRPELELDYDNSTYGAAAVHLGYDVRNENIEWSLGEVMVKTDGCRPDIYYMVSDFSGGYSGFQMNDQRVFDLDNPRGQTFLFSVWSDFDTNNPGEIPDDYQPWTDELGEGMRDGNFGNEGSGVHANWDYAWYPNVIYKFLINYEDVGTVRRNGKNYPNCKAYTCWIYVPEKGEWVFFVRYIRPNDTRTHLGRPGSFVENPGGSNGSSKYKMYLRHWIRTKGAGEWTPLLHTSVRSNGDHPRYDFGWGKETIEDVNHYGGEFCYLFSGGFTVNTGKKGPESGELNFTEMPDIVLKNLPALELFDNMKAGETKEKIVKLDQSQWTATASSEEDRDYARNVLDGNIYTIWTCAEKQYPHRIDIDMQKTEKFVGFYIQPLGVNVPKDFRVEFSEDGNDWTSFGHFTLKDNGDEQRFLKEEAKSARYIRIYFESGYTDRVRTSIREIQLLKYDDAEDGKN